MIVVAIIGILAAIAIPQYQDYVTRARWSDNLTRIAPLKASIAECIQASGNGASLTAAPCNSIGNLISGGYLASGFALTTGQLASGTTYSDGNLDLVGTTAAGGCGVRIVANVTGAAITWTATNSSAGGGTQCNRARTGVEG
jgi:type IV pilus assembly protein PilA